MATPVVLIAGDGIGPEVTTATQAVLAAAGADVSWVEATAGLAAVERFGDPLPSDTLALIRRYRVALKGPLTTPVGKGFRSINVRLRKELDLFASVRPLRTLPGVQTPYTGVDLVVVRENTEGLYSGQEHVVVPGVVESLRIITKVAAERIVRYAFELARNQGRRRVTFCHKADVMPMSDGLFLESARAVADDYPFTDFEEIHVDTLCLQLALDPTPYQVLVMENLFGDVLSDLCAGLTGGLGLAPGANLGARYALFEAVHGSAPDIAGQGKANPIGMLRSAAMMLHHIGQRQVGERVEAAVLRTLAAGKGLTRDLGGDGTTTTITEQLIANLKQRRARIIYAQGRRIMGYKRRIALLVGLLFLPALSLRAEPVKTADPAAPDESRYEVRREHDPDGIGKFYMNREIAQVMGHEAAGWLERPEREKEEQPTKLIADLHFQPGDVVADVGAGSGYLSFRIAEVVGAKGKVLAEDIQPEMLDLIRKKAKDKKIANVEPILGTITDPKLPPEGVDLIVMVDVYHEFDHPYEMTVAMVKALKPGGRLVFVEYRLEDKDVPIKLVHKMSQKQVIKEMTPHALRYVKTLDDLPWQHVIIFEKKADKDAAPGK